MSRPDHIRQEEDLYVLSVVGEQNDGRWSRYIIYLVALVVMAALAWAAYFKLDEVTVATGKVIPSSRGQVIQILESGILRELKVKEGETVQRGQILIELDDTRAGPVYREAGEKWRSLLAQQARLTAEAFGSDLRFPAEVIERPDLVRRETQAYATRQRALEDQLAALQKTRNALSREIQLIAPLVKQGVISEIELLRLRREDSGLERQVAELKANYLANASQELVRVDSEFNQVAEILAGHRETLRRTTVVSPADGIVKDIRFHTVGAVIASGQIIMEIVPVDDEMLVEAFIDPSEVAYVRPGQSGRVKLSAYDPRKYGELDGVVELVSPDTIVDEPRTQSGSATRPVQPQPARYKLLVRIINPGVERDGMKLIPQPGMAATVDILTGQKTVLEYLFRPAENLRDALRER